MTGKCPTPKKAAYTTKVAAAAAARLVKRDKDLTLFPYPCDCGRWHLAGSEQNHKAIQKHAGKQRRR